MKIHSVSPLEIFESFFSNFELIKQLVKNEIMKRYGGSFLGVVWTLFNPICMLIIYTFIFSDISKQRWTIFVNSNAEFALLIFIGLIFFNLLSECLNYAPFSIISNVNYVKKIIFPLEILSIVNLIVALYHMIVNFIVFLIAYFIIIGYPPITITLMPLIIFPLSFILLGFNWALASLGVYVRDVRHIIGAVTTALMFLSPIFYPVSALPESYKYIYYINPLTPVIEQARSVMFYGKLPDANVLIIYWVESLIFGWFGFVFFQKTRNGFSDVI